MKISFHGGARNVTGACYLIETKNARMLVDCGLFQGSREAEDDNFAAFSFDPASVDALFVTHGHLDHVGRIPKLVAEGFRGPIYSTPPTEDLGRLILEDALRLDERDRGRQLFESGDLDRASRQWSAQEYGTPFEKGGVRARFLNAGHILGSAFVHMEADNKTILFTGDLGNIPSLLLPPPAPPPAAEYLVIESTYGSRTHEPSENRILQLERAVEDAASRGGTLLIPAFAAERTQDLLHALNEMIHFKRVPDVPVFVDSPLAIRITEMFERYPSYYTEDIQNLFARHRNLFRFKRLRMTRTVEESKAIATVPPPAVVIAGSGMMTGGRILHHALRVLPDEKSILLIIGYQAPGSLGRRLIDGETEIKILGRVVSVRAQIRRISGFSAHADNPQLFSFVAGLKDGLKRVFVVQGEEAEALHLTQEIRDRLGVAADAPVQNQEFVLE
ncbi:MAG: MBL fold metallo-hydrolase [Candidatus Sungbacteria bacterium]|nr:MBL fold metallo-hydrolase [Candidatus Sungbacteria bacterium]